MSRGECRFCLLRPAFQNPKTDFQKLNSPDLGSPTPSCTTCNPIIEPFWCSYSYVIALFSTHQLTAPLLCIDWRFKFLQGAELPEDFPFAQHFFSLPAKDHSASRDHLATRKSHPTQSRQAVSSTWNVKRWRKLIEFAWVLVISR